MLFGWNSVSGSDAVAGCWRLTPGAGAAAAVPANGVTNTLAAVADTHSRRVYARRSGPCHFQSVISVVLLDSAASPGPRGGEWDSPLLHHQAGGPLLFNRTGAPCAIPLAGHFRARW
jgi:hypothetical protein